MADHAPLQQLLEHPELFHPDVESSRLPEPSRGQSGAQNRTTTAQRVGQSLIAVLDGCGAAAVSQVVTGGAAIKQQSGGAERRRRFRWSGGDGGLGDGVQEKQQPQRPWQRGRDDCVWRHLRKDPTDYIFTKWTDSSQRDGRSCEQTEEG